ncbi:MAG TPA: radical SAM protein, partial [Reyranella sp.]|nr:radical SAM protein [Reyranella sp.]
MTRCNVLLVAPAFPRNTFWHLGATCSVVGARHTQPPLGLMTVAALLPTTWTCRLVDRNVAELKEADLIWADLVMTGGMNVQRFDCLAVIELAQRHGKPVAVGGPDVTSQPEVYAGADFVVSGEAEDVIAAFVSAWNDGRRCGTFVAERSSVDVTRTPAPRFDLVRRSDYLYFSVQFSRGCPFTCEFCDIIELYGRVPRVKTVAQVLGELEALYASGYRGHLDFVDDNFIGNKKAVKALLPALIEWQRTRGYPFWFSTEASLNLADDEGLLALMHQANFGAVFVGIESSDAATLAATRKKQNTRRRIADSVHRIHAAGIFVLAGFIVGFDTEQHDVAPEMIACITEAAIPVCMAGLLVALPNTQLYRRLQREDRLFSLEWLLDRMKV